MVGVGCDLEITIETLYLTLRVGYGVYWYGFMQDCSNSTALAVELLQVQDCSSSIVLAVELQQSCTKPSIYCGYFEYNWLCCNKTLIIKMA